MSEETGYAEKERAGGEALRELAPAPAGADVDVRVTVIPAHCPADETKEAKRHRRRVLVYDFGPEGETRLIGRKAHLWSFKTKGEALIHASKLRELGHRVRLNTPSPSFEKGSKATLNDRLGGTQDD